LILALANNTIFVTIWNLIDIFVGLALDFGTELLDSGTGGMF
jgi:hypothetical protein